MGYGKMFKNDGEIMCVLKQENINTTNSICKLYGRKLKSNKVMLGNLSLEDVAYNSGSSSAKQYTTSTLETIW